MKKAMTVKALVAAIVGIATMIAFAGAVYAEDFTVNNNTAQEETLAGENNGLPALLPVTIVGAYMANTFYVTTLAIMANTAIGTVANIVLPETTEAPAAEPVVQIAAIERN